MPFYPSHCVQIYLSTRPKKKLSKMKKSDIIWILQNKKVMALSNSKGDKLTKTFFLFSTENFLIEVA